MFQVVMFRLFRRGVMAKKREAMNMSAGLSAAAASAKPPAEWWTQVAFVLAVALVLVRATVGDYSKTREPRTADTPRAAGAATGLALDLLCCLPAILVLARRVMDR